MQEMGAAAVLLIRAYAFVGRRTSILLLLSALFLAVLGSQLWMVATQVSRESTPSI